MKNRILQFGIVFILISISVVACSSFRNSHRENVAYLYRHESLKLHPIYKVYHENDSSTQVFYQINLTEFKYNEQKNGSHLAKYQIEYMLFSNRKTRKLLDSNAMVLYDSLNYNQNRSTIGVFNVPFLKEIMRQSDDSIFALKILLTDLNADITATYMVDIDKKDVLGRQNYYLRAEDGFPIMTNYINRDQKFYVVSNNPALSKLNVKKFKDNFSAAQPPHIGKKRKSAKRFADTTYSIQLENGISPLLHLPKQGYYHFYQDSSLQRGLTIYRFTSQYPYVVSTMQTLMPMRYITSGKEFRKLLSSKDKKEDIYAFWKKIGNSPNRTDEIMADYYSLVTQANFLFTSDREGWKTDRGMIYIVFGAPSSVYVDDYRETWVYGDVESNLSVKFDFYKIDSPFSANDYWLDRNTSFGQSWHKAVEIWRR